MPDIRLLGKGNYVLLLRLPAEAQIKVGRLGEVSLAAGYYTYIGSAMRGFTLRIKRYFNQSRRLHWHIDYLLQRANIGSLILLQTENQLECLISELLNEELESVPRFGSSDCLCASHLYFRAGSGFTEETKGAEAGFTRFAEQVNVLLETGLKRRPVTLLCSSPASALSDVAQAWDSNANG